MPDIVAVTVLFLSVLRNHSLNFQLFLFYAKTLGKLFTHVPLSPWHGTAISVQWPAACRRTESAPAAFFNDQRPCRFGNQTRYCR